MEAAKKLLSDLILPLVLTLVKELLTRLIARGGISKEEQALVDIINRLFDFYDQANSQV